MSSNFTPFDKETGTVFTIGAVIFSGIGIFLFFTMFSNILFLLVNMYVFILEYGHFTLKVRTVLKEENMDELEKLRLQHETLIGIQDIANPILGFCAACVYGYGIPVICLSIYGATTNRFDTADTVALLNFLFGVVIAMFTITFLGAHLNAAVSSS